MADLSAVIYGPNSDWRVPINCPDDLERVCLELPDRLSQVVGLKAVQIHRPEWSDALGAVFDAYGIEHNVEPSY